MSPRHTLTICVRAIASIMVLHVGVGIWNAKPLYAFYSDSHVNCLGKVVDRGLPFLENLSNHRPLQYFNREIACNARRLRRSYIEDGFDDSQYDDHETNKRRMTERPTTTSADAQGPSVPPSKTKIVVFGASGKIGRLVVRQLLEMPNLDATIVAFCRDYDKACRVLYDDMVVAKSQRRGPKLQIVQGNVIQNEDLPGFQIDDEEDRKWRFKAESAARFYGNEVEDYDDIDDSGSTSAEALKDAIKDCTVIISCLRSVRWTNPWTDYLERPFWRLLRPDVSDWCKDSGHPFYVHYLSTKKILKIAESEQLRREAITADTELLKSTKRIRFVKISDLVCSQQPWYFVPLVTNIIHSMIFRYQSMAEKLMETSPLIDTITIRPGDLLDECRNEATTSIQVHLNGTMPYPSRIGRDDAASIAVCAALFDFSEEQSRLKRGVLQHKDVLPSTLPIHHTIACRWAGEEVQQGMQKDGYSNAQNCLKAVFQSKQSEHRKTLGSINQPKSYRESLLLSVSRMKPKQLKIKPYGICVAIPVYFFMAMLMKSVYQTASTQVRFLPLMIPYGARAAEIFFQTASVILLSISRVWQSSWFVSLTTPRSLPNYIQF